MEEIHPPPWGYRVYVPISKKILQTEKFLGFSSGSPRIYSRGLITLAFGLSRGTPHHDRWSWLAGNLDTLPPGVSGAGF